MIIMIITRSNGNLVHASGWMEFWTSDKLCHQHVSQAEGAGQRLQAWARGAFREQFLPRGDSRAEACRACESGLLLVDGERAPGRALLEAWNTVSLRIDPAPSEQAQAKPRTKARKRRQMELQGEQPEHQEALGSACFSAYYKVQRVYDPASWEMIEHALRQPLPASVRVNVSSAVHRGTQAELEPHAAVARWLREGTGLVLRSSAVVAELVQQAQATGKLVQQELALMLPVELLMEQLDPRVSVRVIDLCCAPGSKTTQLLDRLAHVEHILLLANDLEPPRVARTLRRCVTQPSPTALAVSCQDGRSFRLPCTADGNPLEFDRIVIIIIIMFLVGNIGS